MWRWVIRILRFYKSRICERNLRYWKDCLSFRAFSAVGKRRKFILFIYIMWCGTQHSTSPEHLRKENGKKTKIFSLSTLGIKYFPDVLVWKISYGLWLICWKLAINNLQVGFQNKVTLFFSKKINVVTYNLYSGCFTLPFISKKENIPGTLIFELCYACGFCIYACTSHSQFSSPTQEKVLDP